MSAEVPAVGSLVWQQMYSPMQPCDKSQTYGPRRLMQLQGVHENHEGREGITRYWLVDPERPNDHSCMSWCESDWCDLEPAAEDSGMLF